MGVFINRIPNPGSAAAADAGTVEPEDSPSILISSAKRCQGGGA